MVLVSVPSGRFRGGEFIFTRLIYSRATSVSSLVMHFREWRDPEQRLSYQRDTDSYHGGVVRVRPLCMYDYPY